MTEPLWLELNNVLDIHEGQLARFGGASGIRDQALIESALARPLNMFHYENVEDLLALSQAERFKQAAREHEADEDEARWEERLRKVAKQKREKPE